MTEGPDLDTGYTTKCRLPQLPWFVRMHVRVPLDWRVFRKQTPLVARPYAS